MKRKIVLFFFTINFFWTNAQQFSSVWSKECDCYGLKDSTGKIIVQPQYSYVGSFSDGLVNVRLNRKSGFINKDGTLIIPMMYDYAESFSEGLAAVKLESKWGFINTKGKVVVPINLPYDRIDNFHEGLAPVRLNGKWGYIDPKGHLAIPLIYDRADKFSYGLAAVAPELQKGYGYINKKGAMVIPAQFKFANRFFDNGIALVSTATESSVHIDRTGKLLDSKYGNATAVTPNNTQEPGNIPYTDADLKNLKIAREAGNLEYIGYMYVNHGAVAEGSALLKKAIAKGQCDNCAYSLAIIDYKSRLPKAALEACESAAEAMKQNHSVNAAVFALKKIETKGDMPVAAYYLGNGFEKGLIHSPKKEIDSAIYYYQKAAVQGYPPAMYALGLLYQYGTGNDFPTPADRNKNAYLIDKKRARHWFSESAKLGFAQATIKVTWLDKAEEATEMEKAYGKGYDAFEANNFEEAYRWWTKAALEGNDAEAYFGLAILHQLSKAPASSLNTAMEYYQKAADLGMKEALAEKQKIQDYFNAVNVARQRAAAATTTSSSSKTYTTKSESYEEWWQKTYGRGGSQNRTPMPDNNIPQALYRPGKTSESDRHQQAMDAIQRSIERQQNRDYNFKNQ